MQDIPPVQTSNFYSFSTQQPNHQHQQTIPFHHLYHQIQSPPQSQLLLKHYFLEKNCFGPQSYSNLIQANQFNYLPPQIYQKKPAAECQDVEMLDMKISTSIDSGGAESMDVIMHDNEDYDNEQSNLMMIIDSSTDDHMEDQDCWMTIIS
ncbi:hypothetical protein BY996DRAFT_8402832 [Phakopsora pachyrhizi]|nr:hypothetical protein BY996DRAFT_8402832 [Phakopsora pachyrhizi]